MDDMMEAAGDLFGKDIGLPIIPLYGDGDLTTMKFIQAEAECSSSPIVTSCCICPIGHIISPLNPINGVVVGTNWFFISRCSRLKQCSYSISEADLPSTYMWCIQCPPISASMIIGPSVPSSLSRGGKNISALGEKLCIIFCLATLSQGWTIRIASALSFPKVHALDFVVESLDEFGVCDSVHESRDSHAFWCSFHIPAFQLIYFHEIFCRFSTPLLDVMEFYRIFDAFLLLKVVF
ncbi:hypothetical protein Tco_1315335 [Tanacetum coccineum]